MSLLWGVVSGRNCRNTLNSTLRNTVHCTVGWVNLYQKFEIEKYTNCGKLILPQKNGKTFFNIFFAQLACGFAWICEYLQASYIQHF